MIFWQWTDTVVVSFIYRERELIHLVQIKQVNDKNLVESVGSKVIFQIGVYENLFGLGIALSKLDISNSVFQKLRDF